MRYHDHSLLGYVVRDFGGTIILHLILKSADDSKVPSVICFEGVVFHHFIHTSSAIILDITEVPLPTLIAQFEKDFHVWNRLQAVWIWKDDSASTLAELQRLGVQAWRIDSAIGFTGWVVAKQVYQGS